ncbi:hypothetical protein [Phaffia rhodozyma]|uniref:Uncharacterized protein n=1 Tax=Phaffia rhodozyma TaxID=264483 RepID=A0A0F7SPR4_PHARH|nr:hypothetical protein [Phaffia rhodozyma]
MPDEQEASSSSVEIADQPMPDLPVDDENQWHQFVAQSQARILALEQQLAHTQALALAPSVDITDSSRFFEPSVVPPETFDGSRRSDCRRFLAQSRITFQSRPGIVKTFLPSVLFVVVCLTMLTPF